MASLTMAASIVGGTAAIAAGNSRRKLVAAKATPPDGRNAAKSIRCEASGDDGEGKGRRAVMLAAAAAAVAAVAGARPGSASAEEPKRGTPEAKKQYNAVCLTMPTARICHK